MRCLSFFGHPCLCLQIPSFQGLGGIFTRWILAMPGTLRSLPPPSMAAFLRYRLSALFGRRVYDSPSRSKPPACFFRAAFVRFRRPPWRLFFAIAQRSLREASLRLASPARLRKSYGAVPQFPFHRFSPGKTNRRVDGGACAPPPPHIRTCAINASGSSN